MGVLIKGCGVETIFLDNLMEEKEGLIVRVESLFTDASLESFISEFKELFLEGRSPRDAVFLLLLNMLNVHVGGIIQKGYVPLHHLLAECTRILTGFTIDIEVDEALGAVCLARLLVEEFLLKTTSGTCSIWLIGRGHRGEIGVTCLRIQVSHLLYSLI